MEDGNHTTNKGTGDKDNTQGTFADEQNAEIREGSVVITVTDDPIGAVPVVEGEDGQLSTNGVEVVTSSGIQPAGNDSNTGDTVVVIINGLPDGGRADHRFRLTVRRFRLTVRRSRLARGRRSRLKAISAPTSILRNRRKLRSIAV